MINVNFKLYKLSDLEVWISNHYIKNGIAAPSDLTIGAVSKIFNIDVIYYRGPSCAEWEDTTDGYSFIFINDQQHRFDRKNDFFHELCHPLRHVGDQELLPVLFQELQEIQATQFQLVAAMPMYLLRQVNIEIYWDNYIHSLSERFEQPIEFVEKRMQQVIAKIEQEQYDRMLCRKSITTYALPAQQLYDQVAETTGKYNITV